MKFKSKELSGIEIISLEGNVLGGPDATELNDSLHRLVEQKKKKVVVDLSEVPLMNSSGLGMLIAAATTMRNAGGELKLAGASEKILHLLKVTKLVTIFEHHPTVKKAIESF
jgi:anti-sigma B factor antagonist